MSSFGFGFGFLEGGKGKGERGKEERENEFFFFFFLFSRTHTKKPWKKKPGTQNSKKSQLRSPPLPRLEDARLSLAHERPPGLGLRLHPPAAVLLCGEGLRGPRAEVWARSSRGASARRRRRHARRDGVSVLRRVQCSLRRDRGSELVIRDPVLPLQ